MLTSRISQGREKFGLGVYLQTCFDEVSKLVRLFTASHLHRIGVEVGMSIRLFDRSIDLNDIAGC